MPLQTTSLKFEEAANMIGDGSEIADEGRAVGVWEISGWADCA
jgi:hypothetical protein